MRSATILPAAVFALALGAGRSAADDAPGLYIVFHPGHTITVSLANGSPVGTTSGAPTVIAPGLYNLFMDDSAAVEGPIFDLKGPGVSFVEDMFYGENPSETFTTTFLPGSTYTWRNDEQPNVVFTFVTSGGGASTSTGGAGSASPGSTSSSGGGQASQDIVGSDVVPFRGALDAIVYASGKLSLSRNGKKVTSLKAGRYTFSVDDESKTAGFTVKSLRGKPTTVTSGAFVGSHDATITLKAGRWFFYSPGRAQAAFFVTS
jgi:hypothetical protein